MNVKQIVEKYLKDNGYDGLYNVDYGCGCKVDALASCGVIADKCEAGYLVDCNCKSKCAFHIGPKPEEEQNVQED